MLNVNQVILSGQRTLFLSLAMGILMACMRGLAHTMVQRNKVRYLIYPIWFCHALALLLFTDLVTEELRISSGVIWAALNIDYPGHSFSHLGIFVGQLSFHH